MKIIKNLLAIFLITSIKIDASNSIKIENQSDKDIEIELRLTKKDDFIPTEERKIIVVEKNTKQITLDLSNNDQLQSITASILENKKIASSKKFYLDAENIIIGTSMVICGSIIIMPFLKPITMETHENYDLKSYQIYTALLSTIITAVIGTGWLIGKGLSSVCLAEDTNNKFINHNNSSDFTIISKDDNDDCQLSIIGS